MIQPESGFLNSFAALEWSLRSLPHSERLLPTPKPPPSNLLEAWLKPYKNWNLPAVYLDYLAHYGGVASNLPPIGIGLRPLAYLLEYRRERGNIDESFIIPLSPGNIDGNLCLVLPQKDAAARVALINGDGFSYLADSFAMYLWSSCFFLATIHEARFHDFFALPKVTPEELTPFYLKLALELGQAGFELLGADSRAICAQRQRTCVAISTRGKNIGVSVGSESSLYETKETCVSLLALLERCHQAIQER